MKKFLDKCLLPICFIFRFIPISKQRKNNNILIIRLGGMGDAIISLPVVKTLSKIGKVTVLTTNETKKIYETVSDIEIINWDTRLNKIFPSLIFTINKLICGRFEVAIDLEQFAIISSIFTFLSRANERVGYKGFGRDLLYTMKVCYDENKHTLECFFDLIKAVNIEPKEKLPKIVPRKKSIRKINSILKNNLIKRKIIGIHPGSGNTGMMRRWGAEKFAKLGDILSERYNADIIITGTKDESFLLKKVSHLMKSRSIILDNLSFDEFIALLSKLDLFICNDTGAMHLSAAIGTPTIGLFGPNTPIRWAPLGKKCSYIYKKLPCSPCIINHKGLVPNKCKLYPTARCMDLINVEDVLEKVNLLLKH